MKKLSGETCVDANSGSVLLSQMGEWRQVYSSYVSFAGKLWPRHAEDFENNASSTEADINFTEDKNLTLAPFTPPSNAELLPICSYPQSPQLIKSFDPVYPREAARKEGTVVVELKLSENGRVQAAQVVESMGKEYGQSSLGSR